jgi:hypothetical protein
MKRIFKWFLNLFKSKQLRFLEDAEKKLSNKISVRKAERIILKSKVIKEMRKFLKLDANSRYIPFTSKDKEEIRFQIKKLFGSEMERLDLRLTENLKIVPVRRKR